MLGRLVSIQRWRESERDMNWPFIACAIAFLVVVQLLSHDWLRDCSMPGFPVHHHFQEPVQTHVHWVHDAIQPSHPLFSPSPPAFYLAQDQSLFQWVSSLHQAAKVLELQASASVLPMNTQDWFPLGLTGLRSLWSKGLSRVFSNTTVQKHQFFSMQPSLWSNYHIHT